jgi:hypothetical protein
LLTKTIKDFIDNAFEYQDAKVGSEKIKNQRKSCLKRKRTTEEDCVTKRGRITERSHASSKERAS